MDSHPTTPTTPKKESPTIKIKATTSAWEFPEPHQELSEKPEQYLGGGYGDIEREMADHYAMNRPAPIKIEGCSSIKNNPFLRHKDP